MDGTRALLRHAVATVAYRGGKAIRGAPPEFAAFQTVPVSRTPLQLLAHLGDLFEWALSIAEGAPRWQSAEPQAWDQESTRFFDALGRFDGSLASDRAIAVPVAQLLQGPVADALTHIGQLMMLRRLAGCPVRSENYFAADVTMGRVGVSQSPPKREFD